MVISTGATQNVHCGANVCKATATDAVLNATALAGMLASGDVKVVAGNGASDIAVGAPFSWTAATTLTLQAYGGITFANTVSVAGPGGITLTTNVGGAGGDFSFVGKGKITFWDLTGQLTINGERYRLVAGISGLAAAVQEKPSGNYALTADYDASNDGTYPASPVPTAVKGKIEGLGNTVSHLTIKDTSTAENTETALFSSNAGVIRDLRISAIKAAGGYEGDLAGLVALNSGRVRNVSVTGTLTGGRRTDMIGGVAGSNTGNWNENTAFVENASFAGKIAGRGYDGGVVGYNYYGAISGASASGSTEGAIAGGVVGGNWGGSVGYSHANSSVSGPGEQALLGGVAGLSTGPITHCFATGTITSTGDFGGSNGGLVGDNAGAIDTSFATASVTGIGANGGLVGRSNNATLTNVYATGAVTHGSSIGGLMGEDNGGSISGAYSIGAVTLGSDYVGGAIGSGGATQDVYWDLDTSDISNPTRGCGSAPNCSGVTGLTDAQMKSGVPKGFHRSAWAQSPDVNAGYPYLVELPPPQSGSGAMGTRK